MNIRQLEYIRAVAELQNFSRAAEKCFITQSTLSTMVSKFEEELGLTIFDRTQKPIELTKEGKVILEKIKIIFKDLEELKVLSQSLKGELKGELKMGIIPTVAPFILPEFLNGFIKKYPDINFKVSEMTTNTIITSLRKREIDVGILAIPLNDGSLIEYPLYNEPFVLYDCSETNNAKYASLNSIDPNKLWVLEEGHCLHTQVTRICDLDKKEENRRLNLEFKAGSIQSLVRFVKKNNGITLLPYLACLEYSNVEKGKIKYFNEPVPVREIGLVVHKHFVKKRILELLESEIKQKILPLLKVGWKKEYIVSPI